MVGKNRLYGAVGHISRIISPKQAEIAFTLEGNQEYAYLERGKFYYNARTIPEDEPLSKYLRVDMQVKFSCTVLKKSDKHRFGWMVVMCWEKDQTPGLSTDVSIGLVYVKARITLLEERHGILLILDTMGKEHEVYFTADKFYNQGRRLPDSKSLFHELSKDETVFCDAIPCIPEENDHNCTWLATCVFKGKRPDLSENDGAEITPLAKDESYLLRVTDICTRNPQTMFIRGRGVVFNIINDDFGLILAEFQYNNYQRILFHRKNVFLFKLSLAESELTSILAEGDRIRFVAVGAPPGFIVNWIAVQISVCDTGKYGMPMYTDALRYARNKVMPLESGNVG